MFGMRSTTAVCTIASASNSPQCAFYAFPFYSFFYYCYCGLLLATLSSVTLGDSGHSRSTTTSYEGVGGSKYETEKKIRIDGQVVFGGLFPMHEKGQDGKSCGSIKKEKGIQRMEAMLFAVDRINKDNYLLPNISVGVHILDTCSFDTYALEQSMDFIRARNLNTMDYTCTDGSPPKYSPKTSVVGVIGAASSLVSIMVANILRLFKIPQISYASTSIDLSDKTRFDYFSRVVPPDSYQAQAMVDIAKHFKWNYVSTLADEGNYGERGISAFEERAKTSGVCIARSLKIPRSVNEEKFDNLVKDLLGVANSRVVVMFVNEDNSRGILRALKKSNRTSELSFLASDSWGAKIHPVFEQESVAESAVTILPKRQKIVEFDDYFLNLRLKNNKRNVWFKEYWEAMFNCTTDEKLAYAGHKQCKGDESLDRVSYQQEGLVQFVIDSVYSLAHAVENMIKEKCNGQVKLCRASRNLPGEELLRHIRNVTFQGIADETVEFNEKGDGPGRYDVYQYQRDDIEYKYIRIGEWTGSLRLFEDKISWRNGSNVTPTSICSEPCGLGYAKSGSDACCWVCVRCNDYQILENVSTCKDCPLGFRPDANKTSCVRLPVLHLQWTTLWAILPITFSALGIVSTIFVLVTFILYSKTPVIMASGRELCYILFLGIFLSYGTSFVMLARPSIAICTIMRLGLGSSLSLVYASMLTKTNRIYRIFNRGIRAVVKRPSYTSPRSQVIICFSLVSVQVVGAFTWIGFERPDIMYVLQGKDALILKCKTSQIAIVISLFYNMFLIILCTVYAFKTRKIPQNFNEAKYIAFTMYSTCIVWLAFIPIYFGANQDFKELVGYGDANSPTKMSSGSGATHTHMHTHTHTCTRIHTHAHAHAHTRKIKIVTVLEQIYHDSRSLIQYLIEGKS
ncbi:metabotropic glutamate receptor 8-like [Octopus sinensis]|uniref:Metabotropic glutamate receptor 8-like n=1 Tax=Octopus sinensis TaxID=2607531 RepID=A0A7E6EPU0_9MOLL|nr:metabotropic glutamate receptor 8-like [Octopus sinensis]